MSKHKWLDRKQANGKKNWNFGLVIRCHVNDIMENVACCLPEFIYCMLSLLLCCCCFACRCCRAEVTQNTDYVERWGYVKCLACLHTWLACFEHINPFLSLKTLCGLCQSYGPLWEVCISESAHFLCVKFIGLKPSCQGYQSVQIDWRLRTNLAASTCRESIVRQPWFWDQLELVIGELSLVNCKFNRWPQFYAVFLWWPKYAMKHLELSIQLFNKVQSLLCLVFLFFFFQSSYCGRGETAEAATTARNMVLISLTRRPVGLTCIAVTAWVSDCCTVLAVAESQ